MTIVFRIKFLKIALTSERIKTGTYLYKLFKIYFGIETDTISKKQYNVVLFNIEYSTISLYFIRSIKSFQHLQRFGSLGFYLEHLTKSLPDDLVS